jgi:hypothetical protein
MEKICIEEDITVFYVEADDFPAGVKPAWQKLHGFFPSPKERRYFGISFPGDQGKIIYRAATEEKFAGEAEKFGCPTWIIREGVYAGVLLRNYMQHIEQIGDTFQQMIARPDIDPEGACVEEYLSQTEMRCLVRLKETVAQ